MKKYKFKVYFFNPQTLEVEVVATCTTKPTTKQRAHELAKLECLKDARAGGAAYEMVTK